MFSIRPARASDKDAISSFTRDTFDWGDYVADRFDDWLADPAGILIVGADEDDEAIAVSFAVMLSPSEAWFQGARVRKDRRREGIAGAMAEFGTTWARERGARIGRLAIEDWNVAARGQVERDGFRATSEWMIANRPIGEASPVPSGNGGRRVPAQEQLVPAHASEAGPAFMSWSTGPLVRVARSLFAVRWQWRQLTEDDLELAAKHDALWTARSGWVLAAPHRNSLEVGWLETREDDAVDLMKAVVDLAVKRDTEGIRVTIPAVGWLSTAARRAGCDLHPITVYAKPL